MKKKILCAVLAVCFAVGLTACGGTAAGQPAQSSETGNDAGSSDVSEAANDKEETMPERKEIVYGNDPNNLFQNAHTPCFGDGRVYYINFGDELSSFALDGSDPKVHGTVENIKDETLSGVSFLNWYDGSVYYMITQYREDLTSYVEIRSMDTASGVEQVVETCEDSKSLCANGMIIINDDLFYSCYDPGNKIAIVNVFSLVSDNRNQLFHQPMKGTNAQNAVVSSDGRNYYLATSYGYGMVYALPLSELYDSTVEGDPIGYFNATSVVFDDEGFYTAAANPTIRHASDYAYFAYENAGKDWPCKVLMEDLIADGDTGSEEGIIQNLVWYSQKWMLGDAMASVSQMNRNLYYSSSFDYTNSVSKKELDFERSAKNGTGAYIGEWENVLYVICQREDRVSFLTLAADGTCQ